MRPYLQKGQAMAEYVIVCAGLIAALFWGANVECEGKDNVSNKCISKLLTVLHDNYDGYASSLSSVQKYGAYTANGTPSDGPGSSTGGGPNGGGFNGGLDPNGLTEVSQIISDDGLSNYGKLLEDGSVVDTDGNVIGFYSNEDNTITLNDGSTVSAINKRIVLDEQGNVLYLRAITECVPAGLPLSIYTPKVYSWGYKSIASGKVFNSVNKEEMDIGNLCTAPSYGVVKNGKVQSGRILNGEYFAATFAAEVSPTPLKATGEVIYWSELATCSVMVTGWDAEVDPENDKDEDEIYAAQLVAFSDNDKNFGSMDNADFAIQGGIPFPYGGCPTAHVISKP